MNSHVWKLILLINLLHICFRVKGKNDFKNILSNILETYFFLADPSLTVRADIIGRYSNRLYTYEPQDLPICKYSEIILNSGTSWHLTVRGVSPSTRGQIPTNGAIHKSESLGGRVVVVVVVFKMQTLSSHQNQNFWGTSESVLLQGCPTVLMITKFGDHQKK